MEMQFTIGQSVEFAFEMGGGGSPAPAPGIGAITGTPVLIVNQASFSGAPIVGTPEIIEE